MAEPQAAVKKALTDQPRTQHGASVHSDSFDGEGAGPSQPGSEKTAKSQRRHSDDYAEHRLKSMREDDTIFPEAPRERLPTRVYAEDFATLKNQNEVEHMRGANAQSMPRSWTDPDNFGEGARKRGSDPQMYYNPRRHSRRNSAASHGDCGTATHDVGEHDTVKHVPKVMFADANNMKAQLHENLDKKDYDVTELYHTTGWAQCIAKNSQFQSLTLFVIAVNAVWIGVDADHNKEANLSEANVEFQVAENFFCCAFTFELLVRWFSFRHKRDAFRDNWFRFDAALVALMVAETWIIPNLMGPSGGSSLSDVSILRLLRLLRLTRLVRIMRSIPELITMLKGVAAAMRSVCATLALLIIALYIFAIIFTQQLAENKALEREFGTIPRAMWTLLLGGTFLDNLTVVLERLALESGDMGPLMVGLFLLFVLISSLTILNMLIGVLCEVVSAVAVAEKEKAVVTYVKAQLIDVLTDLDKDGTGTISKDEFAVLLEVPSAVEALEQLGVDVPTLFQLAEVIFDMEGSGANGDDEETWGVSKAAAERSSTSLGAGAFASGGTDSDSTGLNPTASNASAPQENELTFGEFLEMVLRLRSENSASVPDIVDLRKFIRWNQSRLAEKLAVLKDKTEDQKKEMKGAFEVITTQIEDLSSNMNWVHVLLDELLLQPIQTPSTQAGEAKSDPVNELPNGVPSERNTLKRHPPSDIRLEDGQEVSEYYRQKDSWQWESPEGFKEVIDLS